MAGNRITYDRAFLALEALHGSGTAWVISALTGSPFARKHRILAQRAAGSSNGTRVAARSLLLALLFSALCLPASLPCRAAEQDDSTVPPALTESSPSNQQDIDRIVGCFVETLHNQQLPFVKPPQLKALRNELRDYLTERVRQTLSAERREEILAAVASFVKERFRGDDCYLAFRSTFDMLKWQIWTATEQTELTAEETARLDSQREWMRDYIRGLPDPQQRVAEWQHAGRIKVLENEVFQNPLNPFFREPMSDEIFRQFQAEVTDYQQPLPAQTRIIHAPSHIFFAAVKVQVEPMCNRWPPGFPVQGLGMGGTQQFDFRANSRNDISVHLGDLRLGVLPQNQRTYFDVATRMVVNQPAPFDEVSTRRWRENTGDRGDVYFDQDKLIPARGAKMAVLPETQWYVLDRLTVTQLRELIALSPVDSFSLAELPHPSIKDMKAMEKVETIVLETCDGRLALLRVQQIIRDDLIFVQVRPRPLLPYPPFHSGDAIDDTPPR